jgi:uncharacterized protein (TIGR04222 family)
MATAEASTPMIWPLDAIASMPGPQFLGLYAGVIALALAACHWAVSRPDRTADLPPALVPARPDPLEIAYLRGGANEVTRLLVVNLLSGGQLEVVDDTPKRIVRAQDRPEDGSVTDIEQRLLAWFSVPRTVGEVFQAGDLLHQVELACRERRERLRTEQMLTPPSSTERAQKLMLLGAAVIVGLGGFKLLAAVETNRPNVLFLITAGIGALVLLWKVCRPRRLTDRGREYLRRLRDAYGGSGQRSPGPNRESPQWMSLLVALYGVGILAETSSSAYAELFGKASMNSGSEVSPDGCGSCGSGCGSCGGCGGCGD